MKQINQTQSNVFLSMFVDYMLPNPYFKLTIAPVLLFIYISGLFHNLIILSVVQIEKNVERREGGSYEMIIGTYLFTTCTHYALVFVYMCLMGWYLQKNDIFSFKLHTYQYLMVNHNDFHRMGTGKVHSLIDRRTKAITELIDIFILNMYQGITFVIATNITIYQTFGRDLLVVNVVLILTYLFLCFILSPILDSFRVRANESDNEASNRMFGIIKNYDTIKSFNKDRNELENLDYKLDALEKHWFVFEILQDLLRFSLNNLIIIPNCLILYVALKHEGAFNITTVAKLSTYNKIFSSLKVKLDTLGREIIKIIEHASNFNYDCIRGLKADDNGKGQIGINFNEKIEFVDFGIKIENNLLLENANFEIRKGEKVAIVGKNGTGKSTLMKTLLRFYEHEGQILIDGVDTKLVSVASQRDLMAYIPQTPFMVDGTVLQNLKYANPKITDTDLIELSKTFKTHRQFKSLENGYLTYVGENGRFLSGGQRQQISFLRAIVKNSNVLIIDEPIANLDHVAASEMIGTILNKMAEKTVVIIIHNFQYLSKFDKIIGICDKKAKVYTCFEEFKKDMHYY